MSRITSWVGVGKLSGKAFLETKWLWEEFVKWRDAQKKILYADSYKAAQKRFYKKKKEYETQEILRLFWEWKSYEDISLSMGISVSSVLKGIHLNTNHK